VSTGPVNLYDNVYYDNVYADFASSAEIAVRRETYGEDLGQSSWLTAEEWVALADLLGVTAGSDVLEVGSGSGGPAQGHHRPRAAAPRAKSKPRARPPRRSSPLAPPPIPSFCPCSC
jgi:hypothetical protein